MGGTALETISFGAFELDLESGTLFKSGDELHLRAKTLGMLTHLIRHRGRTVPKDELLEAVWNDVQVSDATLSSTLRDLRRVLGDDGEEPLIVRTVRGRGYRFVAPLSQSGEDVSFVGRRAALERAEGCLDAMLAGRGQCIVLSGEAGIGKTRTAFEIAHRAERRGARLHIGRALEEQGGPPYWIWIQVLRSVLRRANPESLIARVGDPAARALELLPEVARSLPPRRAEEAQATRFEIFDGIARILIAEAQQQPVVLVLDDLHRADVPSLELLRHLVPSIVDTPVLVVVTYRDTEIDTGHPLAAVVAQVHPSGAPIELEGFRLDEVAALVSHLARQRASTRLATALHERTGGNPLFVEEIARDLIQSGGIDRADAPARAGTTAPEGVKQVIRTRLLNLPTAGFEVLCAAAVIGREFDLDLLRRVCADSELGAVADTIDSSVRARVLRVGRITGRFQVREGSKCQILRGCP